MDSNALGYDNYFEESFRAYLNKVFFPGRVIMQRKCNCIVCFGVGTLKERRQFNISIGRKMKFDGYGGYRK